jgi:hypothetical protein
VEPDRSAPVSDELAALDPSLAPPGGLNGDAPGAAQPGGDTAAAGVSDADRMGAMGLASVVVGVLAGGVAKRWPATAYTDPEKESLAVVLAPLLMKWGLNAAWLARWREEATALGVLAQLGLIGYQRVQAAAPPPVPQADQPPAKP